MVARVDRSVRQSIQASECHQTGATELAVIARDATGPEAEKAWADLVPVIGAIAGGVARPHGVDACEYVDDAPGFISERIEKFDPRRGRFESWCATLLGNRFIDLHRHWERDALGSATTGSAGNDGSANFSLDSVPSRCEIEGADVPLDLRLPFSTSDLASIRQWDVKDRVALMITFGLWRKIMPVEWDAWLKELRVTKGFPWVEVERSADPKDRLALLANFLELSYNTVYQRTKRKAKALLPQLRFAREFYGLA